MVELKDVIERLRERTPQLAPPTADVSAHAAVSLLLHETSTGEIELLFIRRAKREGDVWSGDMAFPGGRRDENDDSIEMTAIREVREELGIELPQAQARLDDYDARTGPRPWPLVVSLFIHVVEEQPELRFNHEVSGATWIPLSHLLEPGSRTRHRFEKGSHHAFAPALCFEDLVIWGMTYRMFRTFVSATGLPWAE